MPSAPRTRNSKQETVNCKLESENKSLLFKISGFQLTVGFTLLELLVVMGILGVITGASLLFLTNILRGSNQARIAAEVKQNGQTVLDAVDRQIRNAVSVRALSGAELPAGSLNAIELVLNGGNLYLACFGSVVGPPPENGWMGIASASAGPYVSLTNKHAVSGINIECPPTGTFNVSGNSGDPFPQVVQVSFNVKQGVEAPGRVDFNASSQFKTTISLRKYSF